MAPTAGICLRPRLSSYTQWGRPKNTRCGDLSTKHYTQQGGWKALLTYGPATSRGCRKSLLQLSGHAGIDGPFALDSNTFNQLAGTGSGKGGKSGRIGLAERAETPPAEAERPSRPFGPWNLLAFVARHGPRAIALMISLVRSRRSTNTLDIEKRLKQRGWRRQCRSGAT